MTPTKQQLEAAIVRNQARVIDLLQWDAETYASFIYNSGLKYLEHFIGKDEEAINMLTPRQQFWSWWKILFNSRDEAFIREWDGMEDRVKVKTLQSFYLDIHNPAMLAGEIAPPSIVYGKNFTKVQMATA